MIDHKRFVGSSDSHSYNIMKPALAAAGLVFAVLCVATWALWPVEPSSTQLADASAIQVCALDQQSAAAPESQTVTVNEAQAAPAPVVVAAPVEPEPELCTLQGRIGRGDTFTSLAAEFFSKQEIFKLARKCEDVFSLSRLSAGNAYAITTVNGEFADFEYEINADEKLAIRKVGDDYTVCRLPILYDVETELIRGTVASSLYEAVRDAGETPELAVRLADIFAWDVDFVREIRQGDSFRVLVEKRSRDGKAYGYGRILAAEFVNQGDAHRGYLFEAVEGRPDYYDENGRTLRKAFLKAPLDFRRVSSGFSHRRLHPVLKVYRPHHGIDYAAPTGTPVKAAGDGKVIKATRSRGAGKYVKIRHANGYESAYLHLSRFGRGIKSGKKVRQGQIIGYVGSTGLSTGPHLDFRMKKDGRYINPAHIKSPPAKGVPADRLEAFKAFVQPLQAELTRENAPDTTQEIVTAQAEHVIQP